MSLGSTGGGSVGYRQRRRSATGTGTSVADAATEETTTDPTKEPKDKTLKDKNSKDPKQHRFATGDVGDLNTEQPGYDVNHVAMLDPDPVAKYGLNPAMYGGPAKGPGVGTGPIGTNTVHFAPNSAKSDNPDKSALSAAMRGDKQHVRERTKTEKSGKNSLNQASEIAMLSRGVVKYDLKAAREAQQKVKAEGTSGTSGTAQTVTSYVDPKTGKSSKKPFVGAKVVVKAPPRGKRKSSGTSAALRT